MELLDWYVPIIIRWGFYVFKILLIIYILMSWVPQAKDSPISITIGKIVEPYLSIFRRFIPQIAMIDFSPIVAIFALQLVEYGLLTVWVWFISFF